MLVYEAEIAGAPTTLSLFNNDGGESFRDILYGTSDGKVGLIELGLDEPIPKWEIPNEKRLAGITSLDSYDITNDGIMDLLVSREDGVIELYSYDSMDNPFLKYTHVSFWTESISF
jgi:Bardet-Biedl syndrome 7 protein